MTNDDKSVRRIIDEAPDLAEPVFDAASEELAKSLFGVVMPEIVKDLPVLKYVKTGVDIYSVFRVHKLRKRMTAFLHALIEDKFQYPDYEALNSEEKQLILDILVTELDEQTDDKQAEALALLFSAYIRKDIERLMFHGIAHELKSTNPLVFYFNVDGFRLFPGKSGNRVEGPLHYLPASFYANFTPEIQFSSDYHLTNLGETFFEYIYNPMNEKYSI